ncbi:helix-turn-helix domain-containing protein [Streptomyces sp. WM6372]|uniref:helix-turn-helix domain-containing protein n=1 Tax=Streptomyces sp. WM6372 TaxID=1415555 RepID=UPI00131E8B1A|nr:helix-turn-helix domain-containing protein [Streptomyces sp. WM6372]
MIGNHLLQHRELSATAIGVAAYIQSLPEGAPVGIRALMGRFPEGEMRLSSALRELERHGYLERRRERLENGRVVTRTYSYNKPPTGPDEPPPPPPDREPDPDPDPAPDPEPDPDPDPGPEPEPGPGPQWVADPEPGPAPYPVHPGAADLLAGLRRYDPRLLLAERDVRRLAPAVSAWLDRGADPEAVILALTTSLPEPLRSPASVLAYRLKALLPPHLPAAPAAPAARPIRRPDPFQTCDGCERAFRSPHPGRCRDCPTPPEVRAAA